MADDPDLELGENYSFSSRQTEEKHNRTSSSSSSSSSSSQEAHRCIIREVSIDQPKQNTSPYTPKIISIGPLHHGEAALQPMEKLKIQYQNDLLNRLPHGCNRDELLLKFKTAVEEDVRSKYKLASGFNKDDLWQIMVVDGCFLIEFLLKNRPGEQNHTAMDHLGWRLPWIKHDILFFENQIPFSYLEKLYDIFKKFKGVGTDTTTIFEIATDYLYLTELWDQKRNFWAYYETRDITKKIEEANSDHLLHLYHKILFEAKHQPPFSKLMNFRNRTKALTFSLFRLVSFPIFLIHQLFFADTMYPTKLTSAAELEEAGVRFQGSCMDLRFDQEQGTLFVPVLTLNEESLCLLKNLIAFENYNQNLVRPYVHTYAAFLSDLVNQPEDLKVMEEHHIIMASNNRDQLVLLVSNLLEGGFHNHEALVNKDGFSWQNPRVRRDELMNYCKEPRHRWRAKLMKDYFGNPWSTFGFLIGIFLLVLTILQTVYKVSSFFEDVNLVNKV